MNKTFLFAGASSAIAIATADLLIAKKDSIIGISRQSAVGPYKEWYQIDNYETGNYPVIENAIDGIVYFPGTINLKPFSRLTLAEFQHDMSVNAFGAVAFAQSYLKNLKLSTSPSIVFVSTVAVGSGMMYHSSVAMAKGAIEGLTRSLAAELAPLIRVNCVAPSLVATPLGGKFINTPEKMEAMRKRNPLQKIGDPFEVAKAIAFLLTEESGWITGQTLAVDGGMGTIRNS